MTKKMVLVNLAMVLVVYAQAYGGYTGPSEVLSTTWGNGDGQVGLQKGDSGDEFPWKIAYSPSGRIALCDEVNDRVVIFKADGSFERNINVLSTSIGFDSNDSLYTEAKFRKFEKNGSMAFEQNIGFDEIYITLDDKIIGYDKEKKTFSLYSPTGQLLKTYTERPLELGKKIEERRLADKSYNIRYQYPEGIYAINVPRKKPDSTIRDAAGNLYVIQRLVDVTKAATETEGEETVQHYRVIRYNFCGKETGRLELPQDQYEVIGQDNVIGIRKRALAEYGQPIVASSGDVYTWKRTPDKYSIIKWTWQDDPNQPSGPDAPTSLAVMPSTTGLYLTWKASPQDPGCVTGYEIARASSSGGVYTALATVDKGVLKYNDTTATAGTTYYYKVRAVSGTDYSPYTSEASGKR